MDSQNQGNTSQESGGPRRGGYRGGRGNRGRGGNENRQQQKNDENGESPRHGGFRGGRGGQGGERRAPADRSRFTRRPRIVLENEPNKINLNEVQAAQIKELDEQLKAIGKPVEPPREEYDAKLKVIDDQINVLFNQINNYHHQIDEQQNLRTEYVKANNPNKEQISDLSTQIQEKNSKRTRLNEEIRALENVRTATFTKLKKLQDTTGYKDLQSALVRIDVLDNMIETSTLSNNELKKFLGERDRLAKDLQSLEELEPLQKQLKESKDKIAGLRTALNEIREEINQFYEKRTSAKATADSIYSETQKYRDQIQVFYDKIKELKVEIDTKKKEKKAVSEEFNKSMTSFRSKIQNKTDLEYQRLEIYRQAERIMKQVNEGQKKIGEIKEKVNPHLKDIQAASSLVQYLEQTLEQHDDKAEEKKVVHGKAQSDATLALIQSCKNTKKGKRTAKEIKDSKPKTNLLTHSLQTVAQFAQLDITAPTKIEDIKDIISKLQEKISAWESSFVKANVLLSVKEDGSVAVRITL